MVPGVCFVNTSTAVLYGQLLRNIFLSRLTHPTQFFFFRVYFALVTMMVAVVKVVI